MLLKEKTALVTGASRGIGKAIALALGKQGAFVIGTATTPEGAEQISSDFQKNNINGKGYTLRLNESESIDALIEQLKSSAISPDILINNAGITRDNLFMRMKDEEWESVINTNLSGMSRLTKICIKDMLKKRWGRVINLSSVVAFTGNMGQANYAAAKAGMIGFTRALATELASRNITVNAVAPGFIETDMTQAIPEQHKATLMSKIPAGRLGQPEDIASAVCFLASPMADYITGQTLHVNGGMYMG